jgi:hypothetical protein
LQRITETERPEAVSRFRPFPVALLASGRLGDEQPLGERRVVVNAILRARGRAGDSTGEVTVSASVLYLNGAEADDRTLQLQNRAGDREVSAGHIVAGTCCALRANAER